MSSDLHTPVRWPDQPPLAARRVVIVIAAALVLAACAVGVGHAGPPTNTADQHTATGPTGTAGAPPAPGAPPATLATRTTALGTVATSDGFTIYQFAKDTPNPPATMCNGACAKTWPPVLASDQLALHGLSVAEVGTTTRPDGGVQLTLGGWPVYRYTKDRAPGDTTGQGVGGTWSALAPTGKPIKTAPAAGAAASPAGARTGTTGSTGTPGATGTCTTTAPSPTSGGATTPTVDPTSPPVPAGPAAPPPAPPPAPPAALPTRAPRPPATAATDPARGPSPRLTRASPARDRQPATRAPGRRPAPP